jgi:hypothetical protein
MQATPDKDFDKLFQQRFETFEVDPSSAVWRGITSELDKEKGKKKTFSFYQIIGIAATVLVVLSVGLWLFSPEKKIRLHGKEDVVLQDETADTSFSQPVAKQIVKEKTHRSIAVTTAQQVLTVSTKPIQEEKAPIQEAPRTVIAEPAAKEAEPVKQNKVAPKEEKVYTSTEHPVMAFVGDQNPVSETKRDAEQQHRVKTVGDLVNFVIGKVDPRADKIIQFKNDDEGGSEVTGINLGLVKFKNRNR